MTESDDRRASRTFHCARWIASPYVQPCMRLMVEMVGGGGARGMFERKPEQSWRWVRVRRDVGRSTGGANGAGPGAGGNTGGGANGVGGAPSQATDTNPANPHVTNMPPASPNGPTVTVQPGTGGATGTGGASARGTGGVTGRGSGGVSGSATGGASGGATGGASGSATGGTSGGVTGGTAGVGPEGPAPGTVAEAGVEVHPARAAHREGSPTPAHRRLVATPR